MDRDLLLPNPFAEFAEVAELQTAVTDLSDVVTAIELELAAFIEPKTPPLFLSDEFRARIRGALEFDDKKTAG